MRDAKVVIASGDNDLREGLRAFCVANGFGVVGTYRDRTTALARISRLQPTAAILDSDTPEFGVAELVVLLQEITPMCAVIILASRRDAIGECHAGRPAVAAWLLKRQPAQHLLQALTDIHNGRPVEASALPTEPVAITRGAEADENALPGPLLGRYHLETVLGTGSMGQVYRATDSVLRRAVAIKLLPADHLLDPDRKRRLLTEAQAASALHHPNIVTVYDYGRDGDSEFLVLEYVAGRDLLHRMQTSPPSMQEAVQFLRQAANALAAAHEHGIVHRDIKPANIMITPDGDVRILDFGLAKVRPQLAIAPESSTVAMTQPGAFIGTCDYMSPEQAQQLEVDHRTDIFSLGVILFELAFGTHPFRHRLAIDTLHAIIHDPPSLPSGKGIHEGLLRVLGKALAKAPNERYASMHEMEIEIERCNES